MPAPGRAYNPTSQGSTPLLHHADLQVPCSDDAEAAALETALGVELAEGPPGTRTTLVRKGPVVAVAIDAEHLAGLRAAINNVVRLLDAAQRTLTETVAPSDPGA